MAVAPADGKVLWSYPWQTEHDIHVASPVVSGTQVFITSGDGCGRDPPRPPEGF